MTKEAQEVLLCMEGVPIGDLPQEERGLVLWKVKNQHNIEAKDVSIMHGNDLTELKNIKFEFQRTIDWESWRRTCIPRLKYAAKLEVPHLPEIMPHSGKMAIVGAGPSVAEYLDEIRKYKVSELDNLMSINATHNWLIERGITPRIHVISEFDVEDVEVALGGKPHKDVVYYLSSSCNVKVMRQLHNYKRVIWHPFMPMQGYQQAIVRYFKHEFMVTSGFSTFFKSLAIATILGFRKFELFGIDSSFEDSSHVGDYVISNTEPRINVWAGDRWGGNLKQFTTQGGLVYQAKEFLEFCKYNQSGVRLRVQGNGLLRHLHESRYPDQYV